MRKDEINKLLERFLDGRTTPEEDEVLETWFEAESGRNDWSWRTTAHRDAMDKRLSHNIGKHIDNSYILIPPQRLRKWRWLAAASVLLFVGLSLWLYLPDRQDHTKRIHEQFAHEAMPAGSDAAILVLADGSTVRLDALQEGVSFLDGTTTIEQLSKGGLAYRSTVQPGQRPSQASKETNTIHIPKGSNFQLSLPDGTLVQLNSGSSLTYPLDFGNKERRVTLIGEAFFEVAHEANRPFHVLAQDLDIQVKGTTFNVKAHAQEPAMAVTLATGSVQVRKGSESMELLPGEEASVNESNQKLQKRTVDLAHAFAWKNGYFSFENQSIDIIMADVARWYDYTVEYRKPPSQRQYNGRIARSRPIEDVLASLEALGDVKIKMEERRIVVMD